MSHFTFAIQNLPGVGFSLLLRGASASATFTILAPSEFLGKTLSTMPHTTVHLDPASPHPLFGLPLQLPRHMLEKDTTRYFQTIACILQLSPFTMIMISA